MNHEEIRPIVLARFPRIHSSSRSIPREEIPASGNRWINQALSFKLLAAAAVILVAVAIVPLTKGTSETPAEPAAAVAPVAAWQPVASPVPAEPATPKPEPPAPVLSVATAAPKAAVQPAPVVVTTTAPQAIVQPQPEVAKTPPTPAVAETPTMSTWPNPNHPTTTASEAAGNPSVATRPSEPQRQL